MPGDLGGAWCGPPIQAAPTDVLKAAHDGRKVGWLLQEGVPERVWGDVERSTLPYHI